MKKWSISLIISAALLVGAAFASTGAASAANPYEPATCPAGYEGTPPTCTLIPPPPVVVVPTPTPTPTCAAGQTGTYPNCVTPTINVEEVKVTPNSSTVTMAVNAPGKVKIAGKGVQSTTVSVSPGNVKIKLKLTPKEKEKLKEKGKLTIKVKVTYTPTGGTPVTKTVKVTVKAPKTKASK